jgi:hypothetical protein
LKRVELRSSLVLEAGRQAAPGGTVPVYQFRHLTFQEYLAAVAAVEGHYDGYENSDTLLTPLGAHLVAEEWKEVVPMAAVLAGKQAEALLSELVKRGREWLDARDAEVQDARRSRLPPPPIARLVQCLIEEAEAAPETLAGALRLTVISAAGAEYDLRALSLGPYGLELWNQALAVFLQMLLPEFDFMGACAQIARYRLEVTTTEEGWPLEISRLLESRDDAEVLLGLFAISGSRIERGLLRTQLRGSGPGSCENLKAHLWDSNLHRREAALFAWGWMMTRGDHDAKDVDAVAQVASVWLESRAANRPTIADQVLGLYLGRIPRKAWQPRLSEEQTSQLRRDLMSVKGLGDIQAAALLAFHSGSVVSDDELADALVRTEKKFGFVREGVKEMLKQMGASGRRRLKIKMRSK